MRGESEIANIGFRSQKAEGRKQIQFPAIRPSSITFSKETTAAFQGRSLRFSLKQRFNESMI
jgi:hypothetical protein